MRGYAMERNSTTGRQEVRAHPTRNDKLLVSNLGATGDDYGGP